MSSFDTSRTATTEGGCAASHTQPSEVAYAVSPTEAKTTRFCSLQPPIRPVACWRLDDLRFDFDSSFILPAGSKEFALLAAKRPPEPGTGPAVGPLLTVFGHADPSGSDSYNKPLSERRAAAVYGLLVRDIELWEQLCLKGSGSDQWGYRHLQLILKALGYDPGATDGVVTATNRTAVRAFQAQHKSVTGGALPQDGSIDAATRKSLFAAYMDAVCVDASNTPFRFRKEEFLSRQPNGLKGGRLDYQGCSEFNPIVVFSQADDADYQKPANKNERNEANRPNRRVVVYMFPNSLKFTEVTWPCPASGADGTACHAHFWPNGDERRLPQARMREHLHGGRTFACMFYDRIARGSPCEGVRRAVRIFLYDKDGKLSPNAPYRIDVGGEVREGTTTAQGCLYEEEVIGARTATVEWTPNYVDTSGAPPTYHAEFAQVHLNTTDVDDDDTRVDRQLRNLGYLRTNREDNRAIFSDEFGALVPNSNSGIHAVHGSGAEKQKRVPV